MAESATLCGDPLHLGNIPFPLAERGRSDREEYFDVASENVGLCGLHTPLPFAQDDTLIIFVRRQMSANAVQTDSRGRLSLRLAPAPSFAGRNSASPLGLMGTCENTVSQAPIFSMRFNVSLPP